MILTHLVILDFIPGAGDGSAPPASPTVTANWLSPSIRMCLFLLALWGVRGGG